MNGSPTLKGKVALVTGGSRGIGAAVARRLAADRASVMIAYRSDRTSADAVVKAVQEAGGEAYALAADISQPDDCTALIDMCMKHAGRLDILVNAAGLSGYRPLDQADAAYFQDIFNTNVLGAFCLTRAAAPVMSNPGRIIHFSSRLAETPMPGSSVYSSSKAAVTAMTLALSQELGPQGVTINAVAPGLIETDMTQKAVEERGDAIRANTPLRRIGQTDDISGLVAFLASDDAGWITGRTIRADGGLL